MSQSPVSWPEPVVRVQSLSQSGLTTIPDRYIRPLDSRPSTDHNGRDLPEIPIVDFGNLVSTDDMSRRETAMRELSKACREWGVFQIINHGVSEEMMKRVRESWRHFFELPAEVKEEYANSPKTYEGYGSRMGVEKGAILDWGDYFFLHLSPPSARNLDKWPARALPLACRKTIEEYGEEMVKLCRKLMEMLSVNLGLEEEHLEKAFGGENMEGCLRANFYPKCPQPELTLGCSSHSDPGCLTLLLPDDHVAGLQFRRADHWITVKPLANAFVVNIGDQIQLLSNAMYKSANHRVRVNAEKERLSVAYFCNPKSNLVIEPAAELVSEERPALYVPMTYDQYRLYIREKGLCGKAHIQRLSSFDSKKGI